MSANRFQWALICFAISSQATSQPSEILHQCELSTARDCQECMSIHSDCVWITDKNIQDINRRCTISSKSRNATKKVIGQKTSIQVTTDEDFHLPSDNNEPGIQIRPQKIKLRLRKNEEITFQLRYKVLSDYPLDIYYLLDQTNTMIKHRENLQALSDKIATSLAGMTRNYRIAFGYFSDKVAMPFYAMVPKLLDNPCLVIDRTCAPGSNFVHSLNFTQDANEFIRQVSSFNFTANMDDLEGSFDALLQIILCQRELAWRNHSRKMIVLATDGWTHFAGDGLLAGIVKKHPFSCSMRYIDEQFIYDGLNHDYPSVEEVFKRLLDAKISLILAIQEKEDQRGRNFDYYKQMKSLMDEVALLAELDNDPHNIIRMVESGFQDKIKKVIFKDVKTPKFLQVKSLAYCNGIKTEAWRCSDIKVDTEYVFNITVRLRELPISQRIDVFYIEEMSIHEKVEIEVEYPEQCDCDSDPNPDPSINGVYSCGIYKCNKGWEGERCDKECNSSMGRFSNDSYISLTCSKHGDFDMNTCRCICDREYSGKYCETICDANKYGQVCSNNGICQNSKCKCFPEFTGDICDCPTYNKTCKRPGEDYVCSNRGKCECGKCVCTEINSEASYNGEYCQFCQGCQQCAYDNVLLKHIAGKLSFNERQAFTLHGILEYGNEYNCSVLFYPNSTHYCDIDYSVDFIDTIFIRYYPHCKSTVDKSYIAGTAAAAFIVVLSIAILIIGKIIVTQKDKRACAKLEQESRNAEFKENRIYISPITTYQNPKRG